MTPQLIIIENKHCNKNIKVIREINDSEYKDYKTAVNCINHFMYKQQLFTIVLWNYNDFQNLLDRYLEEYTKNQSMNSFRVEINLLDINRHILNYLSSFHTFINHNTIIIHKSYGKYSKKRNDFKKVLSKTFDNHFSYRFLYQLRNYAQHCGMPVGIITFDSKIVDPQSTEIHHSLIVNFDRDELLNNYDKWRKLIPEIQELPPQFEIKPIIDELMNCIERINYFLIKEDLPELIQSVQFIKQLISSTKDMEGTPCILIDLNRYDKRLNLKIENIPLDLIETVLNTYSKYRIFDK